MPELPEVETMVRGLRSVMEGRRILSVRVRDPFILDAVSRARFERSVGGSRVRRVWRRGKWVVFDLTGGLATVIQPRMTGGFRAGLDRAPPHSRIHFRLDGPHRDLWFCDTRRLGKVALLDEQALAERLSARHHGPEGTDVSPRELARALAATRRPIKAALLDQRVVSGVGNIYADESLFNAGIHPERRSNELTAAEVGRLCRSIRRILRLAIRLQGTTMRNYFGVFGEAGSFQDRHRVYGRGGEPCVRCGANIVRANIDGLIGRSTHYCPLCQAARTGRQADDAGARSRSRA
jgi:formamidopyrimidine-DNA glycosylase